VLDEEQVFGDESAEALGKRRGDLETQEITTFTPPRSTHKEVEPQLQSPLKSELTPPDSAPSSAHGNKPQPAAEPVPPLPTIISDDIPSTAHDEEKSEVHEEKSSAHEEDKTTAHEEDKTTTHDEEKTAEGPEKSAPDQAL